MPTRLMASEATVRKFHQTQIHIANYGVACKEIQNAITRHRSGKANHYEGIFVGRFHAQKGLDDLIVIWRRVQQRLPTARLAIVGGGTGWPAVKFEREARAFQDGTASLLGVMTGAQKYATMSSASAFLFPSHHESWGHVALEAMAVGLPVIGYDLPSSREAFGDAMIRVPAYDVDAFANAVIRCLCDEGTKQVYRKRGLRVAKKYDWDRIAQDFAHSVHD